MEERGIKGCGMRNEGSERKTEALAMRKKIKETGKWQAREVRR